jgi:phosphoserine phosphatase RsbU/P
MKNLALTRILEAGQSNVDAVERDRVIDAGLVRPRQVETLLEYLQKSGSHLELHKALHTELEDAKDVQRALFPPQSLAIPGLSVETFYQPAHCIGGDYYDLFSMNGGGWGIAIGDVSGKGIGAALLMASLRASVRAQALYPHLTPSTLIGCVNRLVYDSSPAHCFASLFYAEYEPATRLLKYVNAGHNPPVVVRPANGSVDLFHLRSANVPIGVAEDTQFSTMTFRLQIDDILVAYTDGITEAEDREGRPWGEQALEELMCAGSGSTTKEVVSGILAKLSAFANGQPQRDDMTLVVVKVLSGSACSSTTSHRRDAR